MKIILGLITLIFLLMILFVSIESHDFKGWDYHSKHSRDGICPPMPKNSWSILTIPLSLISLFFLAIFIIRGTNKLGIGVLDEKKN